MIEWNADPEIFSLGFLHPRWYGVLFALAFVLSYNVMQRIFSAEKKPQQHLDTLAIAIIVATLVGARVGHVLFYEPKIFLENPFEVFAIWNGGLASHGGAIGIALALLWFHKKHKQYSFIWLLDRTTIVAALSGTLIRIGNFMNSEILGYETDVPWAIWFKRVDHIMPVYRHPAMLYEAIACMALFVLMWRMYKAGVAFNTPGRMIGVFFTLLFTFRFFIEFLKQRQVAFENTLPIDMGQILSIPFIIVGIYLWVRGSGRKQTS